MSANNGVRTLRLTATGGALIALIAGCWYYLTPTQSRTNKTADATSAVSKAHHDDNDDSSTSRLKRFRHVRPNSSDTDYINDLVEQDQRMIREREARLREQRSKNPKTKNVYAEKKSELEWVISVHADDGKSGRRRQPAGLRSIAQEAQRQLKALEADPPPGAAIDVSQ